MSRSKVRRCLTELKINSSRLQSMCHKMRNLQPMPGSVYFPDTAAQRDLEILKWHSLDGHRGRKLAGIAWQPKKVEMDPVRTEQLVQCLRLMGEAHPRKLWVSFDIPFDQAFVEKRYFVVP